jgi:hypothetical protein
MINIASIVWPDDKSAAVKLYLGFLVKVIESLHITFDVSNAPTSDPLSLVKGYLNGLVSEEERNAAALAWWSYLDSNEAIRDLQDKNALMARLAICLLSAKEKDVPELGEHLSWFLEVLGFLGVDIFSPINIMASYFDFSSRQNS